MAKIYVGSFVKVTSNAMGIGKICAISTDRKTVEVTYFHSINKQVSGWFPAQDIQLVVLEHQTRCYYYDTEKEEWKMGRALRKFDDDYEVDFPNTDSRYISQKELFVRCAFSLPDPMEVLSTLGQETAFFHKRRDAFLKSLMEQRSVTRGMTGLISSNISLMAHQVEVIRRVLEDPVPRYLLADEVGLGKTIEAGVILRQNLLDQTDHCALVLAPTFLLTQWEDELTNRCQIDQFDNRVLFEELETSNIDLERSPEIVIVDEAQEVAKMAFSPDAIIRTKYDKLRSLCHQAKVLLLLSATPVLNNEREFLSMLHLLDPDHHRLEDLETFRRKIDARQEVGKSLLSFREDTKPFLLKGRIASLRSLFDGDKELHTMLNELEVQLNHETEEARRARIRRIRIHISETYRLHRRMLRSRRESVGSLFLHQRGEFKVAEEWDLDERTEEIHRILDDYRLEAWASERELWEDEEVMESGLFRVWMILLEAACTDESLLRELLLLRKNSTKTIDVPPETSTDYLTEVPLFDGEVPILERLLRVIEYPSIMGDKVQLLTMIIKNILDKGLRKNLPPQKIIVFTQFTQVCRRLTKALQETLGSETVGGYYLGLDREQIEQVVERFKTSDELKVLVCDRTGEIGRNFQFADHMIHYDLPFAPNRLEQRLGRLDRLGRFKPFRISVLAGPDAEVNFQFAWHRFLRDGLEIYNTSISSLQFFIDAALPSVMRNLYIYGIPGLDESLEEMREKVQHEKVRIAEQQVIDEIDAREQQASNFFEQILKFESSPEKIKQATEPWICEALQFHKIVKEGQVLYKAHKGTIVPTRIMSNLHRLMERFGCYDREKLVLLDNTKLFRIGDPFFDTLSDYLRWDDRGQTYAFRRRVPSWNQDRDWLGFRLHYIVEGNIEPISQLLESRGTMHLIKVYERLLDKFFEPVYITVSLDYLGNPVDEEHESLITAPFRDVDDGGTDINLIKERLQTIRNTFSSKQWQRLCLNASVKSREHLQQDPAFIDLCQNKVEQTKTHFQYQWIQMELRQLYQGSENHRDQFDEDLYNALLEGIKHPRIHLDSGGFIILTGRSISKFGERA